MRIRTKLLLVMIGLLIVSTGLSFFLHLQERQRIGDRFESVVREIVARSLEEIGPGGHFAAAPPSATLLEMETITPRFHFGELRWEVRVDRRLWLEDEDPYGFPPHGDVLPDHLGSVLLGDLGNPLEVAHRESLPREFLISGAVFLVGLGMIGLLAGRLTRPIKQLTDSMERVARGDLDVRVEPTTRDEVRQMSVAFNTMVSRLREKRVLERKMFQAERLSAMGSLAASVAHDVRNPLNTIGLTLNHLRDEYAPEQEERRQVYVRHMDDIRSELDRLNDLVRNFLDLAHPDRGEREPCDLGELVRDSLRLFRKEAESRGVTILTRFEDCEPLVLNPQQTRAAVTNIIINALKAMDGGRGELTVSLFRRTSGVHTADGGPEDTGEQVARKTEVVLRIGDTGCGIGPETIDRVFLPYFTTREEGTGLGLPIARGAVEANGGRVEIRGHSGRGTDIDIVFPLDPVKDLQPARA